MVNVYDTHRTTLVTRGTISSRGTLKERKNIKCFI